MLTTAPIVDLEDPEEYCPEPPPRTDEERQAWYREGIESLREYRRTGLHITLEELEEWVEKLKTDPHTPMPECHT